MAAHLADPETGKRISPRRIAELDRGNQVTGLTCPVLRRPSSCLMGDIDGGISS
jgi:hypothetical protein